VRQCVGGMIPHHRDITVRVSQLVDIEQKFMEKDGNFRA